MSLKKYQHITNLKKAREQGFTIVELLIVIIVIAILAALVITAYSGVQQRARESAARQKASEAEKALIAYHTQWGKWPEEISDLNDPENTVRLSVDGQIVGLDDGSDILQDRSKVMLVLCGTPDKIGGYILHLLANSTPSAPIFFGDINGANMDEECLD